MTQKDNTDDSRIGTIGRAIANPKQNNPIDAVRKWYGRTFGLPGVALIFAICTVIAFRRVVLLFWSAEGLSTLDLALSIVVSAIFLILGLITAFLTLVCLIIWWLDDGERIEILGIGFRG